MWRRTHGVDVVDAEANSQEGKQKKKNWKF